MSLRLLAIAATVAMFAGCAGGNDGPGAAEPAGSRSAQPASLPQRPYLDQPVPGLTPERFAPGIVSTDAIELNGVFSADGREFYFTRIVEGLDTMHQMTLVDGTWGEARQLIAVPGQQTSGVGRHGAVVRRPGALLSGQL
jgi:hypothetical protein